MRIATASRTPRLIFLTTLLAQGILSAPDRAAAAESQSPKPAEIRGWQTTDGSRAPDLPHRRSAGGLGGWLLVTDDADWQNEGTRRQSTFRDFPRSNPCRSASRSPS